MSELIILIHLKQSEYFLSKISFNTMESEKVALVGIKQLYLTKFIFQSYYSLQTL